MENRLKTPEKFRFPLFETFQWYAFKYHQQQLKEANACRRPIKAKLLADLKYLRDQLKKWISSKNVRSNFRISFFVYTNRLILNKIITPKFNYNYLNEISVIFSVFTEMLL